MLPTINIEDADALNSADPSSSAGADVDRAIPPGEFPDAAAPVIPAWYKVGWRAVSGIDSPQLTEGEEKDKGVLDMLISEQFYGDWYHNATVIIFVCAPYRNGADIYSLVYRLSSQPIFLLGSTSVLVGCSSFLLHARHTILPPSLVSAVGHVTTSKGNSSRFACSMSMSPLIGSTISSIASG